MKFAYSMLLIVATTALSGCAGMTFSSDQITKDLHGVRYYQTAPFLFVRSDGKGGLTSEIVYLPDTTEVMSVRPYAFMATNDAALTFTNGVLTEASATVDETVVPNAFVDALGKVATAAMAADLPAGADASVPPPYLFKITVDGQKITLEGGAAIGTKGEQPATIKVTVSAGGK